MVCMAIDVWECGWKLQGSTLVIMVLLFTMMGAAEGLVRQHADDDGWGGGDGSKIMTCRWNMTWA